MSKRYKPNDGWISAKLPLDVDEKLREVKQATRLSITAILCNGIEREWAEWKRVEALKEGGK